MIVKKIICNDCELPIEVYGNKKKRLCKQCYARFVNSKNRGVPYVPFKNLSDEEKERILRLREVHKVGGKSKAISVSKPNVTYMKSEDILNGKIVIEENINIEKERCVVLEDIKKAFETNNIKYPLESNSILPIFQSLKALLDGYGDYIKDFLNAEDILNKMEMDYRHAKEYFSSLYQDNLLNASIDERTKLKDKKDIWEERHNILLNYRRDIKNTIVEYERGGSLILELANNKEFMDNFNDCYYNLVKVSNILNEGSYKAEISGLVESEDFCIGFKSRDTLKQRYNVTIKIKFKGSSSTFSRNVVAFDEEDAKQQVVNFIESQPEKFKFTWMSKDISVYKLENRGIPQQ